MLGGRYRVEQRIGMGGFGAVYQAEHVVTQRKFAVKVLLPEFTERPKFAERFMREAKTTARIEHENVVDIIDVGRTDTGQLYFAMELLRGETLEQTLAREHRLPWRRARTIMLQICDGLRAAHDKGVVHRDLKPANIFRVTRGGNPDFIKILDFGIAKLLDANGKSGATGLTSNYEILGTPLYMSPEQTASDPVDRRTDIYAVGVMLFEMLTGQRPYTGSTHVELMSKILVGHAPRMSDLAPEVELPEALEIIVATAMARDKQDRFRDMKAMITALEAMDGDGIGVTVVRRPPVPLPAPAPDDTLLASTPADDLGKTQVRAPPIARESPQPNPVLLVAGSIALGAVTIWLVVLGTLGRAPEPRSLELIEAETGALAPRVAVTAERLPAPPADATAPGDPPPAPEPATNSAGDSGPRPVRAPGCEAALSSLASVSTATVRRCARNTGVTAGDRLKLRLSGTAGGKLEVHVVEGSGSRDFDGCLARSIAGRRLPANAAPARCQRQLDYRVP